MNKINPIRETDDEAIELAGSLIYNAMHGVLAAHDAASAHPHVSRIQLSISDQGNLVTLISSLSSHTKCLLANPVCSILIGEPGKGDPLLSVCALLNMCCQLPGIADVYSVARLPGPFDFIESTIVFLWRDITAINLHAIDSYARWYPDFQTEFS